MTASTIQKILRARTACYEAFEAVYLERSTLTTQHHLSCNSHAMSAINTAARQLTNQLPKNLRGERP
jgi:hypothetical protein